MYEDGMYGSSIIIMAISEHGAGGLAIRTGKIVVCDRSIYGRQDITDCVNLR